MSNVLLLRSPKPEDRYDSVLQEAGLLPVSVPVLETSFCNTEELKTVIHTDGGKYVGVVVTSGRAAEAWNAAVATINSPASDDSASMDTKTEAISQRGPSVGAVLQPWFHVPLYAVGKATASVLSQCRYTTSAPVIRGEESGNGEALGHFIVNDPERTAGPLLYLTGDKNRDALPSTLRKAGIAFRQIQVYGTHGSSMFGMDLSRALQTHEGKHWWIVFFAPSAADFAIPILKSHFDFSAHSQWPKVAAIGPTTAEFLQNKMGFRLDVVAESPTPAALLNAITSFVFVIIIT